MDVIPIISDGFNIYFPIMIVLLCIGTYFSLGSRLLHFLGINQFIGDDDLTQELVDEGREIVNRERRQRDRKLDSEARRREWNEKYAGRDGEFAIGSRLEESEDLKIRSNASRYTVPRSPDENDKSELLRQAEPIDYISSNSNALDDFASQPVGGYQSQAQFPRSKAHRSSRAPPKGLFDDV